jgi:hypothetical protein
MVMDPFTATLADFRQWADTTQRKLAGDPGADAGELLTLFELMRDDLEIARPGDLGEGDLERLLLRIYPREILVLDRTDTEDTVPAVRDFLSYLTERGEMPDATVRALERELDRIEPQFADAVLDSPDWEPFDGEESGLDLKEAFGLPDQLPPMRLPPPAELAAVAGRAPLIGQLLALAYWAGAGRPVNEDAELTDGDAADAAAALGIGLPDLDYLRWLALDTGFLELDEDETHAVAGQEAQGWLDGDDDERLDIWETVFTFVMDALEAAAALDPRRSADLDFSGHGTALAVMLFLARAEGISVSEASEVIRDIAVGELAPERAAKAWQSWVRAHGDPARLLLDRMVQLGAVQISGGEEGDEGELARLTPLGLAAMRTELIRHGVEVPLLPSPDQMTAADLIAMADGASEEEFEAETAAWLARRPPESAARDLLSAAADADPASRMLAVAVVTEIGAPAEPAWREALGRPEVRGYAKTALIALASGDPEAEAPPGLELDGDDLAWVIIDTLVTDGWSDEDEDAEHDPAGLAERLREAIPPGREPMAFEMMARVPHPDAASVLTAIGQHHPDKKVAKLARKSAYKAASRQATQRR